MTSRCEPPPELRDRMDLHVLRQETIAGVVRDTWFWNTREWVAAPSSEEMHAAGWRYERPADAPLTQTLPAP